MVFIIFHNLFEISYACIDVALPAKKNPKSEHAITREIKLINFDPLLWNAPNPKHSTTRTEIKNIVRPDAKQTRLSLPWRVMVYGIAKFNNRLKTY